MRSINYTDTSVHKLSTVNALQNGGIGAVRGWRRLCNMSDVILVQSPGEDGKVAKAKPRGIRERL
jgi:hypothetical protein